LGWHEDDPIQQSGRGRWWRSRVHEPSALSVAVDEMQMRATVCRHTFFCRCQSVHRGQVRRPQLTARRIRAPCRAWAACSRVGPDPCRCTVQSLFDHADSTHFSAERQINFVLRRLIAARGPGRGPSSGLRAENRDSRIVTGSVTLRFRARFCRRSYFQH